MKTILASTYAVNPYKGSEDAMGWNYVMQLARFHKVIAVTRENNAEHILKFQKENPNELYENIEFLYFDLPYWMRFWKKKNRGALLYFYMWQKGIVNFVKKQKVDFDFAHNLNFHNDWTPSFLWKLRKPFVWGPIGHHPEIPEQYLGNYSKKDKVIEFLKNGVKKYFWRISPTLKRTIKNADHIMCMNGSVEKVIDISDKSYSVTPSVATQDYGWSEDKNQDQFTMISAGRFVPLKGFDLTVKSFGKFINSLSIQQRNECKLILVGDGPDKPHLKELVEKFNITEQVEFISWIERKDLMVMMKKASGFIFPSHEGAGMVVPEALSFGLPCVVLDNWGPGQFINEKCGFKVKMEDYDSTVDSLAQSLYRLYNDKGLRAEMSSNAREHFVKQFHWDRRGEQMKVLYDNLAKKMES